MSSNINETTLSVTPMPPISGLGQALGRFTPFALPLLLGGGFVLLQWRGAVERMGTDTSLVVLALISYISATVLYLINLYQKEKLLERMAVFATALGFGLNLAAWGTRGLIVGYYPLSNLYDTALAFSMTTAGACLVLTSIYQRRFVGALTLPVSTTLLTLAILFGNQINDLPPVLVSYWRPIHVSIAMTAYGTAALTFALGSLYLLKDGVKFEAMALFASIFAIAVLALVSGGTILTQGAFHLKVLIGGARIPIDEAQTEFLLGRVPYVGEVFRIALFGSLAAAVCFGTYLFGSNERLKKLGHWLSRGLAAVLAFGLGLLFYEIRTAAAAVDVIAPSQRALLSSNWLSEFGSRMEFSFRGAPVELTCIFVAFGLTLFVVTFGWRPQRILDALPSLVTIDDLTYRAVTVAFPLLTMMTITGAVWANESWGRYWGWDPKETWALITWLFYATFLHVRITRGWKGRRTALFAVLGFMSVIFTYLGVSFILPGLHSYAG